MRPVTPATPSRLSAPPTPALVVVLLLLDGLHFVWARILHDFLPPMASVPWYFMIATIQLGAFAAWRGKLHWRTFTSRAWFFLAIGAFVATSTTINYTAVGFIDPGAGTLLSQSIVVYNLVLGVVWLKDRLTRPQIIGALLCALGVIIISFQPGDYLRIGSLMVVSSAFLYSLHAALVKKFSGDLEFIEFFFWRVASTTAMSLLAVTVTGQWQLPSGSAWLWLIAAATADVVISRALYYVALRRLTISLLTLIMTLSPVMAAIWSYVLFGILPSLQQVLGGVAVVAGVATVTLIGRRKQPPIARLARIEDVE